MNCACVHHDARMCYRIRYHVRWDVDDEVCECPCHEEHEDEDE